MLRANGQSFSGKTVVISGSGNVAIYAAEKATHFGAKVVTMSDSDGYIYDEDGIDLSLVKEIKETNRGRIKYYLHKHPNAVYESCCKKIWSVKCDIALPCATQNELELDDAKCLIDNGCIAVAEGANMPSTPEAVDLFIRSGILFGPAKAANAGGVATSALEMTQNSIRYSWSFDEVDSKLKEIMVNIYHNISSAADEYSLHGNLVAGANIAGFIKVADTMLSQGVV